MYELFGRPFCHGNCAQGAKVQVLGDVQSYYEDQKREQMQGPAWQRLAQEQQQSQLSQSPEAGHLQQQSQHQAASAPSGSDQSQDSDDSHLQQHGPVLASSSSGSHQQRQLASHALNGSLTQSLGPGVGQRMSTGRGYASPKPPLPRRPPISSEMAFLGTVTGNGSTDSAESQDDAV